MGCLVEFVVMLPKKKQKNKKKSIDFQKLQPTP
jgi:hypothetical protein